MQSVALSGDGRYLAWLGLDNMVHRYDLRGGSEDLAFAVSDNTYIAGVAAGGVLVAEPGGLSLRDADGEVPIPVASDGDGWASDVARDLVTVTDEPGSGPGSTTSARAPRSWSRPSPAPPPSGRTPSGSP